MGARSNARQTKADLQDHSRQEENEGGKSLDIEVETHVDCVAENKCSGTRGDDLFNARG